MNKTKATVILLVVGLAVWGCTDTASKEEMDPSPVQVVTVKTSPIMRKDVTVTLTADGATSVKDRGSIVSPVDGTIVRLSAEVGSKVHTGDTLASVRTRDSEASLAGARQLLEAAHTPQQQKEAEKALQVARENEILIPIVATRDGVVIAKSVSEGQTITANTNLLQVADLSTLDFLANVPLSDLSKIKVGQSCTIDFPSIPDRSFGGKVVSVSAQSDFGSQTVPVRIHFGSHFSDLRSIPRIGMMGVAHIIVAVHEDALVVPSSALLRDDINGRYWIYTVTPDSLARQVPVTVGQVSDSLAEISASDLSAGQPVIVQGNYEVSDSLRISVEGAAN